MGPRCLGSQGLAQELSGSDSAFSTEAIPTKQVQLDMIAAMKTTATAPASTARVRKRRVRGSTFLSLRARRDILMSGGTRWIPRSEKVIRQLFPLC